MAKKKKPKASSPVTRSTPISSGSKFVSANEISPTSQSAKIGSSLSFGKGLPIIPCPALTKDPIPVSDLGQQEKLSVVVDSTMTGVSAKAVTTADPGIDSKSERSSLVTGAQPEITSAKVALTTDPAENTTEGKASGDSWCDLFKGGSKKLEKTGTGFMLPSGESCVKIPNSVIEENRKSWDSFILGQFYSDPPSHGIVHNIVNGIWSRNFRDITVTRMEGFAFLFRIPNASARARILNQRLWKIEGQTMFVAKWEPGFTPVKPELKEAPIWLELRKVPLQFFNDGGLARIASLVGHPKFLHPSTANKTNLEVAKVFTVIDPRKPLPEFVNVEFDSGERRRVEVSSPWMPPICEHCKEVGHSIKRCKLAPVSCSECKSTAHVPENCPRKVVKKKEKEKAARKTVQVQGEIEVGTKIWKLANKERTSVNLPPSFSKKDCDLQKGTSSIPRGREVEMPKKKQSSESEQVSEVEPDSSDLESSDSEEGEINSNDEDDQYIEVKSRRNQRRDRGIGPKSN